MQVPLDYPAACAVVTLAGCVNRRARIQPKRLDHGWKVVPNLYGAIVASPGLLKSPLIKAITAPAEQIQQQWIEHYDEELRAYEAAKEEFDIRYSAWKEESKRAAKKRKPLPERPDGEPEGRTLRRLIMNDATFEALHQTMAENPSGVLVIRDELPGWWATLDKAGREGERAFCLQCWNGDTGHTIDRIGRGRIHVPACCMSLFGGIQPGRLRSYLAEALADGPANDGLIQRFQVVVWPDFPKRWQLIDRPPDSQAQERLSKVLSALAAMSPPESEKPLRFDPEAQELFNAWWAELETKLRSDEIHPALQSHLAKYRSLMPSLAVLFYLADRVAAVNSSDLVGLPYAQQAAAWCDYLESHAVRLYSCITTPELRAARELASKLGHRKVTLEDGRFRLRDVYLKSWSGLSSPDQVRVAANVLEDAGWIRRLPAESNKGGRPPEGYEVNPRIWS